MTDETTPAGDGLSKRERQKLRREERRREELGQLKSEKRKGVLFRVLLILLVLAVIGYFVGQWWAERAEERELREAAMARLGELGCTEIERMPSFGAGHIEDPSAVPPSVAYPSRPATSGPHFGSVVRTGVYEELVDERILVHNLEHGYVVVYYRDTAPAEQVEQLLEWGREQIDGGRNKLIVTPAHSGDQWETDAGFAIVAWDFRQFCENFDPGVVLEFIARHYGLAGHAPEKGAPAHTGAAGGVLDPADADGPLVLPPLDERGEEPAGDPPPLPEDEQGDEPGDGETADDGESADDGETADAG